MGVFAVHGLDDKSKKVADIEAAARRALTDLVLELEALPPEAVDDDLLRTFAEAERRAAQRAEDVKNGKEVPGAR